MEKTDQIYNTSNPEGVPIREFAFSPKCESWEIPPDLEYRVPERILPLIGQRKGNLLVIGYLGSTKSGARLLVRCDCGKYEPRIAARWRKRSAEFNDCQYCAYERKIAEIKKHNLKLAGNSELPVEDSAISNDDTEAPQNTVEEIHTPDAAAQARNKRKPVYSHSDLFAELKRIAILLGRAPTISEWTDQSKFSRQLIYNRFVNWADFVEKAALSDADYSTLISRKKYTEEFLTDVFKKQRAELGKNPTLNEFAEYAGCSAATVISKFGGYKNLVIKCGFTYSRATRANAENGTIASKITRKTDLNKDIIRVFDEIKRIPELTDYAKMGNYPVPTILRLYKVENWLDVIETTSTMPVESGQSEETFKAFLAAKENYSKKRGRNRVISDKRLFDELDRIHHLLHHQPTSTDWNKLSEIRLNTPLNRYKSWKVFIKAAGFNSDDIAMKSNPRLISEHDLIKSLRELAKTLKRTPKYVEYLEESKAGRGYSFTTIKRCFGSWRDFVLAAKLKYKEIKLSEKNVKEDLKKVRNELNRYPKTTDYRKSGKYSLMSVINLFGNCWKDVLTKVFHLSEDDLRKVSHPAYRTNAELLEELRALSKKLGYTPPTTLALKKKIKVGRLIKAYGGWENVLKEAKLPKPRYRRRKESTVRISDDELKKELYRVAELLDRIPTTNDLKAHSKFSLTTINRRLGQGSYTEAVKPLQKSFEKRVKDLMRLKKARPLPARLGEKLLFIRSVVAGGVSHKEMAQKLGFEGIIGRSYLSRLERNQEDPTLGVLCAYADLAAVSLDVLVRDDLNLPPIEVYERRGQVPKDYIRKKELEYVYEKYELGQGVKKVLLKDGNVANYLYLIYIELTKRFSRLLNATQGFDVKARLMLLPSGDDGPNSIEVQVLLNREKEQPAFDKFWEEWWHNQPDEMHQCLSVKSFLKWESERWGSRPRKRIRKTAKGKKIKKVKK